MLRFGNALHCNTKLHHLYCNAKEKPIFQAA